MARTTLRPGSPVDEHETTRLHPSIAAPTTDEAREGPDRRQPHRLGASSVGIRPSRARDPITDGRDQRFDGIADDLAFRHLLRTKSSPLSTGTPHAKGRYPMDTQLAVALRQRLLHLRPCLCASVRMRAADLPVGTHCAAVRLRPRHAIREAERPAGGNRRRHRKVARSNDPARRMTSFVGSPLPTIVSRSEESARDERQNACPPRSRQRFDRVPDIDRAALQDISAQPAAIVHRLEHARLGQAFEVLAG
jgi:hypothetical protein